MDFVIRVDFPKGGTSLDIRNATGLPSWFFQSFQSFLNFEFSYLYKVKLDYVVNGPHLRMTILGIFSRRSS